MNIKRIIIINIFGVLASLQATFAQGNGELDFYDKAYSEITDMLEGRIPLSIRRAVFLAEWAYFDGYLDYEKDFCEPNMTPLSKKETIAYQLSELALSYYTKYRIYDEFTLKCTTKALEYYKMNPNAIIIKAKSLEVRESLGYKYAKENYQILTKGMKPGEDKFNFVSHSMGGAFSEGMMKYLSEQGWETENAVFLNAWEPTQIRSKTENTRIDATCTNDPVQFLSAPIFRNPDIPSSNDKIRIKSGESIMYIHRDLIDGNSEELWKLINDFLSK